MPARACRPPSDAARSPTLPPCRQAANISGLTPSLPALLRRGQESLSSHSPRSSLDPTGIAQWASAAACKIAESVVILALPSLHHLVVVCTRPAALGPVRPRRIEVVCDLCQRMFTLKTHDYAKPDRWIVVAICPSCFDSTGKKLHSHIFFLPCTIPLREQRFFVDHH